MKDDNRLVESLREQIRVLRDENANLSARNNELLEQIAEQERQAETFKLVKEQFDKQIADAQAQKTEYETAMNEAKAVMAKYKSDMQKLIATITKK